MDFPALVYKGIGPHQRENGSYDYKSVDSDDDYQAAISGGWFPSLPEAIEGFLNDKTPPTLEELKEKATQLGIPFRANIKYEKLLALVNDMLSADDDSTDSEVQTEATTQAETTDQAGA